MVLEKAGIEINAKLELFSTQFFTRLVSLRPRCTTTNLRMTEAKRKHDNVHRWTKYINIFKHKKVLLFPINEEDNHWYLIMVVMPDPSKNSDPYFAVLDSIGDRKDSAVEEIRNYLIEELKSKDIKTIKPTVFMKMKIIYPKLPRQPDGSSCGLYLIHFVNQIVKGLNKKSLTLLFIDESAWFDQEALNKMRYEISMQIRATGYNFDVLPDLQFFPTAADDKFAKRQVNREAKVETIGQLEGLNCDGRETTKENKKQNLINSYLNYVATIKNNQKDMTQRRIYDV